MSNPDAVRPTGETGETRPSERSCHLAAQAWCRPETSDRAMDVKLAEAFARILDEQLGPRMPWSEMSGSEKEAVYNNAPRPLPDFPAGAPGPWDRRVAQIVDAKGTTVAHVPTIDDEKRREAVIDFILSRVSATPATAGRALTREQEDECAQVGYEASMKFRGEYVTDVNRKHEAQVIVRAALAHAESLLSSRATGAEVEIPALTHRDYMEIIHGDPDSNLPYSGHVSEIVERAVAYARRHATMRGGGE